jgi:hypothetical protein
MAAAYVCTLSRDANDVVIVTDEALTVIVHIYVAVELVHELAEYLSRRYPGDFTITRHAKRVFSAGGGGGDDSTGVDAFSDWGWNDLPAVKTITMTSTGVSYDLPLSLANGDRAAERAMEIAGLL